MIDTKINKKYKMILKNERGVGLPIAIIFIIFVIAAGMFIPNFIERNKGMARKFNDDFKMKVLAISVNEIGKYLLFYEKAFFLDNALEQPLDSKGDNIFDKLVPGSALWNQVCGDPSFSSTTSMQYDGKETFCPLKLRDPFLSGDYLESFLYNYTDVASERFTYDTESKSFHMGPVYLDFKGGTNECGEESPDPSTKNYMFHLMVEPKMKCYIESVQLDYYFYGKSASFTSYGGERYVKIVSTINYKPFIIGSFKTGSTIKSTVEESLMYSSTTMKDFALFLAYPAKDLTGAWDKTANTLQHSLRVANNSRVYGKTFFDGNLRMPIGIVNGERIVNVSAFPYFNDALIITGTALTPIPPSDINIRRIKSKFKKGILTNFGEHLIFDSEKIINQTSGLKKKFINSDFERKNVDINVYVTNMVDRTECSFSMDDQPLDDLPRTDVLLKQGPPSESNCQELGLWGTTRKPVFGGGLRKIVSSRDRSVPTFVMAPATELEFTKSQANFLGIYVGGRVNAAATTVNFYSLLNIHPSRNIAGIADFEDMQIINTEASKVQAGVGVPLRNLVLVLDQ